MARPGSITYPAAIVPLLTGLLPILAINGIYLVAALQGHVPWCMPYWDSCSSISATGRSGAGFYLFKGLMIPAAVLLAINWLVCRAWIAARFDALRSRDNWMLAAGVVAAVCLVLYVVALGAAGDAMRLQRRIGVILYFTLTYLAQLLLASRLRNAAEPHDTDPLVSWQLRLAGLILAIGLLTLALDLTLPNYDDYEDAFEWIIALLVHVNFLLIAKHMARTGFVLRFEAHDGRQ